MIEALWSGNVDGGPTAADDVINAHICRIRSYLKNIGVVLPHRQRGVPYGVSLVDAAKIKTLIAEQISAGTKQYAICTLKEALAILEDDDVN